MAKEDQSGRAVEQLNSLLRGEISAVQTYDQAIEKLGEEHGQMAAELRRIAQEHGEHAQELRARVRTLGGNPADSAGAWGDVVQAVEGASKLFGEASALKTLREGEEHGLRDYRDALSELDLESRRLVQDVLLPAQLLHIQALDAMIGRLAPGAARPRAVPRSRPVV
jgi:uncharacterized protein (TIGR02284 family)